MPGPAGTARPVPHAPNRSGTRSRRARRRRRLATVLIVAVGALAIVGIAMATSSSGGPSPSTLGARIVTAAESQLGYRTDPPDSYCNKFSAYWDAGTATCPSGLRSEEWCADFAAWTWKQAGADFTYELAPETSTPHRPASTSGPSTTAPGIRPVPATRPSRGTSRSTASTRPPIPPPMSPVVTGYTPGPEGPTSSTATATTPRSASSRPAPTSTGPTPTAAVRHCRGMPLP